MNKHLNRKIVLSAGRRAGLLIAAAVLFFAMGAYLYSLLQNETTSDREIYYDYSLSAGADYEVILAQNDLYPDGRLKEGRLYSRRLSESLEIAFLAQYKGSEAAQISGEYEILALIQGFQQQNSESRNVIYERREILVPKKSAGSAADSASAGIEDRVTIDLVECIQFADQADIILGAKPNRDLQVIFSGSWIAETPHGRVEEPFVSLVSVPLGPELFSIGEQEMSGKTGSLSEARHVESRKGSPLQINLLLAGEILIVLAAIVLLFFTRRPLTEEAFGLRVKEILRRFGSRMVCLEALPAARDNGIAWVGDLESLVKVADELQRPICYALDRQGLFAGGVLCVLHSEAYYAFRLKEAPTPLEV